MKKRKPLYGQKYEGVWFDNTLGIYMGDAIIKEAIDHGFDTEVKGIAGEPYQESSTWSKDTFYHELWDEAENYMQQFAADGYYFGSNGSCDWGLFRCEDE